MDFDLLKPLRVYINKCTKDTNGVNFNDVLELEVRN